LWQSPQLPPVAVGDVAVGTLTAAPVKVPPAGGGGGGAVVVVVVPPPAGVVVEVDWPGAGG
jgi:hypothetical protein